MSNETIRIAAPPIMSNVDGPGRRRVVYLQGCPVRCPGCQSKHLWDEDGGLQYHVEDVAFMLLDDGDGMPVTISGGEPFAQAEAVARLLEIIRAHEPGLHIVIYSGFCIEDLLEISLAIPAILDILNLADVLVDGPFIQALDHDRVQWRGSSNQRPIDLNRTCWFGTDVVDLALEDWDVQTLTIDLDGDVTGTAGTMSELFDESVPTRRCGQVDGNPYA